ncbi:chemotaxis protein CheR [Niastella yeongjuensis]|uniref:Chemotaxis protein CheR n=1 Tax=Niastella yeongjuensis TaxID=354355 RepID=A0A1V9EEI6_9BACT|nr:protein-glutamate O-methyltransferase CheR [Niastella yeongjuensis]OQP44557.1 chemotaxis protein CheR [Niastella yeongjuensis]SEO83561.1 chemotaxis protein methyltransferase CheR [Niastella yeongjuensis]
MIANEEYRQFLESVRFVYGYDFTEYAEASVIRRISAFMDSNKIASLQDLGKMILKDETEFEHFIQEITVNVTEMYRDPLFYKSLRKNVVSRLATYPFIKVWIAGCSTGEEVYSMAILFREEGLLERTVIYATDINQDALQKARDGISSISNMKTYTENYLKAGGKNSFSDYYKAKYNSVMWDKSLRQNIVFSVHNLAMDRSFNEFQLILCRNVLIYFNQSLQNKVINLFYESLCPFGFIGLGNKESLLFSEKQKYFEEVDRKEKIFMRTK